MDWHRSRRLARLRVNESICDFARAFDCRSIDTWIIRAVYEEFSDRFPVRASDHLRRDLRIDGDDLDDHGRRVAQRAGRSVEGFKNNPMYGRIETLRDLVMFLQHQPRTAID